MPFLILLAGVLSGLLAGRAVGQQPTGRSVVIYLHGRIVEEQGPDAVSAEFGRYAYHAILDSLRTTGALVLGEIRPSGTNVDQYAAKVAGQVDSLIRTGVSPGRITVVGFSKGGGIAMNASARLGRTDVQFVFLGICGDDVAPKGRVAGRILSVFERSDSLGQSCRKLLAAAAPGTVHHEVAIATGLKHGAFYRPQPEWLTPVRAWIRGEAVPSTGAQGSDSVAGDPVPSPELRHPPPLIPRFEVN